MNKYEVPLAYKIASEKTAGFFRPRNIRNILRGGKSSLNRASVNATKNMLDLGKTVKQDVELAVRAGKGNATTGRAIGDLFRSPNLGMRKKRQFADLYKGYNNNFMNNGTLRNIGKSTTSTGGGADLPKMTGITDWVKNNPKYTMAIGGGLAANEILD